MKFSKLLSLALVLGLMFTGCDELNKTFGWDSDPAPQSYVIDGESDDHYIQADLPTLRVWLFDTQGVGGVADSVRVDVTECRERREDPCPDITSIDQEVRVYASKMPNLNQVYKADEIEVLY